MVEEFEKQLKRGVLDIIILDKLSRKSCHGYELLKEIKRASKVFAGLKEGTLYPRLYRLLEKECVTCRLAVSEEEAKVKKVYEITEHGQQQLIQLLGSWNLFLEDMMQLLHGDAE